MIQLRVSAGLHLFSETLGAILPERQSLFTCLLSRCATPRGIGAGVSAEGFSVALVGSASSGAVSTSNGLSNVTIVLHHTRPINCKALIVTRNSLSDWISAATRV